MVYLAIKWVEKPPWRTVNVITRWFSMVYHQPDYYEPSLTIIITININHSSLQLLTAIADQSWVNTQFMDNTFGDGGPTLNVATKLNISSTSSGNQRWHLKIPYVEMFFPLKPSFSMDFPMFFHVFPCFSMFFSGISHLFP